MGRAQSAESFALFEVCGRCYELRGPFDYTWKGTQYTFVQECRCERDARPDDARPPTWISFDFNTGAELCNACGAEVLASGSRWSVWFCAACKERAVAFNDRAGVALVPIGRHSLMHRTGLQTTPPPSDNEIGAFVTQFGNLVDRMRRLDAWAHEVVRRNLVDMGVDEEPTIALSLYLAAGRNIDRTRRFDEMVEWTKSRDARG